MRPMDLGPAGRAIDPHDNVLGRSRLLRLRRPGLRGGLAEDPGAGDARPLAFDRRADYHQDRVVGRGCVISRSAAGLAVPETLREQVRITSSAFGTRSSSWNKKRASVFRLRRCLDENDNQLINHRL